jgi:GNAT superfamily N-acetyltransferase
MIINVKQLDNKTFSDAYINNFAHTIYKNFEQLASNTKLKHSIPEIIKLFKSPNMYGFLLYDGQKIIGYLIGEFNKLKDNRTTFYISYLFIADNYRGKKLASKLVNYSIDLGKKHKLNCIMLICDTHDKFVHDFYEKKGFMLDPMLRRYERHDVFSLYI